MADTIDKQMLISALLEAEAAENDACLTSSSCNEPLSEDFERRREEILAGMRGERRPVISVRRVRRRKIVALVIAAAVLLSILCIGVSGIREKIANFFLNFYDTYIYVYSDSENERQKIEDFYYFDYIPEGYVLEFSNMNFLRGYHIYSSKKSTHQLELIQNLMGNHASLIIDSESTEQYTFNSERFEVLCFESETMYIMCLEHNRYGFEIKCGKDISLDELKKMIDSLTEYEDTTDNITEGDG